jgi:DNA repair protein RadC
MKFYAHESDSYREVTREELLEAARTTLAARFRRGRCVPNPRAVMEFLHAQLAPLEHEVFCILWLDNRHRVIQFDQMFRGTIDGASVHPREVVKQGLALNAAACILAHGHPSGIAEPSDADQAITQRLRDALSLVEIRLLDHVIVGETCVSMAERGAL